jgi:hypothetical protein
VGDSVRQEWVSVQTLLFPDSKSIVYQMSLTGSGNNAVVIRTTIKLYRDCFRLINHIAGKSQKGQTLKRVVGGEFRKNSEVKDPAQLDALKGNAVRALSNYLMMESATKDDKFKEKIGTFASKEAASLKKFNLPKPEQE